MAMNTEIGSRYETWLTASINGLPALLRLSVPLTLKLNKILNKINKGQYADSCIVAIKILENFIKFSRKDYLLSF